MGNDEKSKRFNLSITRIVFRLFLTGVLGVIFGVAMIPFLRTGEGLLYEQRRSMGVENINRMVVLWGLFTLIVVLATFWKKRFRMVSVLLVVCWLISLGFVAFLYMKDSSTYWCQRSSQYPIKSEFNRALDLISQRLDIENNYNSYQGNAFNFRNCIDIQYSSENTYYGTEGLFLAEDPTLQKLTITVNPAYENFDDLSIATLLMHELTHAGQYIYEISNDKKNDCFKREAEAFTSQAILLSSLNPEEMRSINSRLQENIDANPSFGILVSVQEMVNEAARACEVLRAANNLSQAQYNECVWTGTQNKLEVEVKNDPFYQQQCKNQ